MKTVVDIKTYDTVTSFLAACNAPPDKSFNGRRYSHALGHADWMGTDTYEAAEKLALYGWERGLEQVSEKLALINKTVEGRSMQKSVAGSHPDVARFIAGMPDCMNSRRYTDSAKKPCLDIVLNCSYSSRVNPSNIINYGTAIASVIDELENSGYSVSLNIGDCCELKGKKVSGMLIDVKKQGENMDIGKLIFFIAHPSFLRRLAFSWLEANNTKYQIADNYGSIYDIPEAMRGDLYFGKQGTLSECNDMEGALAYVKGIVSAQMPELLQAA